MKEGWEWPELDWQAEPCNTALLYIGDEALKERYVRMALDFMRSAQRGAEGLPYMVFAEQRLLAMLAQQAGITIHSFATLPELFVNQQQAFTHLWGEKQKMRDNPQRARDFCMKCVRRLQRDFPQEAQRFHGRAWFSQYLE